MAVKTLSGFRGAVYEIAQSNTTVNMKSSAEILSSTYGIHVASTIKNTQINVDGTISAVQYAIIAEGKNADVDIGKTGILSGQSGVLLIGQHSSAVNNGEINAPTGFGLYQVSPDGTDLRNNGSIDAVYGMVGSVKGHMLNDGDIRALAVGMSIGSSTGETFTATNHGTIVVSANGGAIFGGSGDDKIINDGKLTGFVYLASGDDTFDTRGGSATSSIMGGADDDVYIVDKASFNIVENVGEGNDTIRSTVSYTLNANVENLTLIGSKNINGTGTDMADTLRGNSGNNVLKGMVGSDHLYGGKGDDKLYGGVDMDTDYFHFGTGDGHDVIYNYYDGTDQIHLENWAAITSLADLKNNHATNEGHDLLIHAGADTLLIKGINKADLNAGDVYF